MKTIIAQTLLIMICGMIFLVPVRWERLSELDGLEKIEKYL